MCIFKLIVCEFSTSFVLVSSLSIGYISDLVVVREMKTTFNFLPWHVRHANDENAVPRVINITLVVLLLHVGIPRWLYCYIIF